MQKAFVFLFVALSFFVGQFSTGAAFGEDHPGTILGWPTAFNGRYPVGTPPGEGWNYVSGDGKVFSSACIGKPRSPQCLVDTMMACAAWSDLDAGWPTETDAEEFLNHPICKALMNYPGTQGNYPGAIGNYPGSPGLGLRVFGRQTREPQNWMIYYKLDQSVVDKGMLESPGMPERPTRIMPCEICEGDIAIIPLIVLCFPDPSLAKKPRDFWVYETYDYPPNSPITYCLDWTNDNEVLFTRHHPTRDEWYVGTFFNVARQGSAGKPWPMLEAWYDRFQKAALPGFCPRRIKVTDNCPPGTSPQ